MERRPFEATSFEGLPAEVRNQIWHNAVKADNEIVMDAARRPSRGATGEALILRQPQITCTSTEARNESLRMFYSSNTFVVKMTAWDNTRLWTHRKKLGLAETKLELERIRRWVVATPRAYHDLIQSLIIVISASVKRLNNHTDRRALEEGSADWITLGYELAERGYCPSRLHVVIENQCDQTAADDQKLAKYSGFRALPSSVSYRTPDYFAPEYFASLSEGARLVAPCSSPC